MSALAKVPHERVVVLIASGRTSHLRALLHKSGLPRRTFPAFVTAIEVIRSSAFKNAEGDEHRATQLIDAIVARYQERPDRELDQILMLLRRFAREAKRAAARDFATELLEAA